MGWTDPTGHVYTVGETVSAATLNTYIEANLAFLYGDAAWTSATLTNSWANLGSGFSVAGYRKQGSSVLVRGRISGGTMNATIFTLPSGYRPVNGALLFAVSSAGVFGEIQVDTAGLVKAVAGTNTDMSLNFQFDTLN